MEISIEVCQWAIKHTHNTIAPNQNLRKRVAGASYFLAVDLFNATCLLATASAQSGALVLARSIYENYFRGLWLSYVAKDDQIELYVKGKLTKTLKPLIKEVAKANLHFFEKEYLLGMEDNAETLDSLTHGGLMHLRIRNIFSDKMGTRLDKNNMIPLVLISGASVVVSCVENFYRHLMESEEKAMNARKEGCELVAKVFSI